MMGFPFSLTYDTYAFFLGNVFDDDLLVPQSTPVCSLYQLLDEMERQMSHLWLC